MIQTPNFSKIYVYKVKILEESEICFRKLEKLRKF